jgi:hypothetical protein
LYDRAGMPFSVVQAGILVGTQVFFVVLTLIPHRASVDGRPMPSDGLQLLRLFSGAFPYAVLLEPYRDSALGRSVTSPASSRIADQLARVERWTSEDARSDIHAALRRELTDGGLSTAEEMLVLDVLVTDGLIFADPAVRPHLDQWSLRALQLGPKVKTLIGSRGAVLVELGQYQKGKRLLETLAFSSDAAPFDALLSRVFLARAEHALGNADLATSLMRDARSAIANPGGLGGAAVLGFIERIEKTCKPSGDVRLRGTPRLGSPNGCWSRCLHAGRSAPYGRVGSRARIMPAGAHVSSTLGSGRTMANRKGAQCQQRPSQRHANPSFASPAGAR